MDESDLERILKGANKLRLLDVRGCSRIGDSGLVRIPAWDLEHLYLSGKYKMNTLLIEVFVYKYTFKCFKRMLCNQVQQRWPGVSG